jgi:MoaA/NifB/PqqE/SkfB family radical SAM enzyme
MELSESKLLSIVDEAAQLGVREWIISGGGEPMVRKRTTLKILTRIKVHGMWGQLTTNGTLFTSQDARRLVEMSWDQVQVSLDGPDAETQDYLRQGKGVFERATRTVRLLTYWKKRLKSGKPYVGFNTVLNRLNYDKLDRMVELAHRVGSQLVYIEPIYAGYLKGERLDLNSAEKKQLKRHLRRALQRARQLGVSTNADHFFETYLIDKSHFDQTVMREVVGMADGLTGAPCFQPWYLMGIKGSGLAGCCSTFEVGEYIHHKNLSQVWFGPVFEQIRHRMVHKKIPPYCSKCSVVVVMDNRRLRRELIEEMSRGSAG